MTKGVQLSNKRRMLWQESRGFNVQTSALAWRDAVQQEESGNGNGNGRASGVYQGPTVLLRAQRAPSAKGCAFLSVAQGRS
jgi:hypothetical protein